MTPARRHLIYYYFLTECLFLRGRDAREIESAWQIHPDEQLIRSIPSKPSRIIQVSALADAFDYDLSNVPGFFYDYTQSDLAAAWKINLRQDCGLLRPYTDERGRIAGLLVYRSAKDSIPKLLTSAGLALGAPATPLEDYQERSLVA